VRVVRWSDGELVAEVRGDVITLRPIRTRAGGPCEVSAKWGAIYIRALDAKMREEKRAKRLAKRLAKRSGVRLAVVAMLAMLAGACASPTAPATPPEPPPTVGAFCPARGTCTTAYPAPGPAITNPTGR
jgi:hypothetical protein